MCDYMGNYNYSFTKNLLYIIHNKLSFSPKKKIRVSIYKAQTLNYTPQPKQNPN